MIKSSYCNKRGIKLAINLCFNNLYRVLSWKKKNKTKHKSKQQFSLKLRDVFFPFFYLVGEVRSFVKEQLQIRLV